MGEGLYHSRDGLTAYAEPYDELPLADPVLWHHAYDDLVATIRAQLSDAWARVDCEWRDRTSRIVARNRYHELWLTQDSYDRVHITFGVCRHLDDIEPLARRLMPERAEAFFDRLQMTTSLRVRISAWTSAARIGRAVAA